MRTLQASLKNIEKGVKTDWVLYDIICENPNLSMYAIHKKLGWSSGKVQKAVNRLEERGYIESRIEYSSARPRRIINPADWKKVYKILKEEIEE